MHKINDEQTGAPSSENRSRLSSRAFIVSEPVNGYSLPDCIWDILKDGHFQVGSVSVRMKIEDIFFFHSRCNDVSDVFLLDSTEGHTKQNHEGCYVRAWMNLMEALWCYTATKFSNI